MTVLVAAVVGIILFILGLVFRSVPPMVILVQVLWLVTLLSFAAVVFMWTRYLRKQLQHEATGNSFPVRLKEFAALESGLNALLERNKYMELEKWDRVAKQAGDSLMLVFSSTTDSLTGAANRRRLEMHLEELAGKERPLSVIMMDMDHFKKVNDTYGHQAGDEVLKHFAAVARKSIRPGDLLARYGGEEFAVVCRAGLEQALEIAERIRKAVQDAPAKTTAGKINVTASFGVAEFREGDTPESVIKRADEALYRAKEAGRNKVKSERE